MEGFEHVVKVALEAEQFIVAGNLKFPVKRQTRKAAYEEMQEHGYEVDLVGARADKLVLASVKSYFGSHGVSEAGFCGLSKTPHPKREKGYILFNEPDVQQKLIAAACNRFGYAPEQVELRLYVGKFRSPAAQQAITEHLAHPPAGLRPAQVIGLNEILDRVLSVAGPKTYFNDPVIMTLKALKHADMINSAKK
ncbi:hypothetical protein [Planctellipticum variicoloris]|uniref:hypothetical protein n=1 Tax=Planctellipticum variicoloris TaxID=3064265 RepID=UPI0030137CFB|nr:hypothetical protein SH412_004545 [Planctomycetaceae bacterium SH412]